jgi:hypothetical protein
LLVIEYNVLYRSETNKQTRGNKMAKLTEQEVNEFYSWFAAFDLGDLEDVRDYVALEALCNSTDCEFPLEVTISTVCYFTGLSAFEKNETFGGYRK